MTRLFLSLVVAASLLSAPTSGPTATVSAAVTASAAVWAAPAAALEDAAPAATAAASGRPSAALAEAAGSTVVEAARSTVVVAAVQGWRWPLLGEPVIVRRFDGPAKPWLPGHRGVDLAGREDAAVLAAGGGVVRFAGVVVSRPVVSIGHADGLITTYEPVEPLVAAGDIVRAGQPVGRLRAGHAGCSEPACLHWGLRRGEMYLDPLTLVGVGRVRLLPAQAPTPATGRVPVAGPALLARSADRDRARARGEVCPRDKACARREGCAGGVGYARGRVSSKAGRAAAKRLYSSSLL